MLAVTNPNQQLAVARQLGMAGASPDAQQAAMRLQLGRRAPGVNQVQIGAPSSPQAPSAPTAPPPTPYGQAGVDALQQVGTGPVRHPLEALARAITPVAGNFQEGRNMTAQDAQKKAQQRELAALLRNMGVDPSIAGNQALMGNQALLAAALKGPEAPPEETYGQPMAVTTDRGPGMVQFGNRGSQRDTNLTPPPARPPLTVTQTNAGGEPNYGTPPTGMAWSRDEAGKVRLDERGVPVALPIGGGPADTRKIDEAREVGEETKKDVVTGAVDDLVAMIDASEPIAGWWSLAATLPGTPAKKAQGLVSTIKANVGFDRLQQMRAESKTGAALGQVTERELAFLQSVLGSLDQAQDAKTLRENVLRVRDVVNEIVHGSADQRAGARPPDNPNNDLFNAADAILRGGR